MADLPEASEITGQSGELVQRLCMALDAQALEFSEFMTASVYLTANLGFGKVPFSDEQEQRAEFLQQLSDRLTYLVGLWVNEAFLVRAVRDMLTKQVEDFADVQRTAEKRASFTEPVRKALADPAELAAYRRLVEDSNPEARQQTDEEFRAYLESIINLPQLGPPDADTSTAVWTHRDHWERACNTYLSDHSIDTWVTLYLRKAR